MPNENEGSPSTESLDQLIAEAESQVNTPVTDHERPCSHVDGNYNAAGDNTVQKCPTCLWDFCTDCQSILDPRYCRLCLREIDAELKELPLVDTEGHTIEHGRVLIPSPNAPFFQPKFGTLTRTISEMNDPELETFVKQYIELVRQAEKALDFRRVVLGSAQLEQAQRGDAKRRVLRSDKTKYAVKTITIDKKTGKTVTKTAGAAALGDMLKQLQMLQALKKMQAAKKAAEQAGAAVDAAHPPKEPSLK